MILSLWQTSPEHLHEFERSHIYFLSAQSEPGISQLQVFLLSQANTSCSCHAFLKLQENGPDARSPLLSFA